LKDADLVIEAVFEDMDVKEQVFEQARRRHAKPGAILASNTSTLDVDRHRRLHQAPAGRDRPALLQPGQRDAPAGSGARREDRARTCWPPAMQLAKKIKKVAVVSGVCDGFIGNRMLERYGRSRQGLIDEGALPQQIDGALQKFGMAMGPFRMGDLAGLDIGWATRKRRRRAAGDHV
jgi:3-hydroxyacyl-CoA dehydrogenase